MSSNVPAIVIGGPGESEVVSEASRGPSSPDHAEDERPRSIAAVPQEDEHLLGDSPPVTTDNKLQLNKTNGHLNGSLPVGIHAVDKLEGKNGIGFIVNEETGRRRHQSKSAGDINKMNASDVKKFHRPRGVQKTDYSRPLYRKDIFYSGSVLNVPHFKSQPDVQTYVKSMMSIPEEVPREKESCLCQLLPKSVKDTVREMMDVTLFREPIFLVAAVGNLFAFIGLFVPFVFITDRALEYGVSEGSAAFLLSVIGLYRVSLIRNINNKKNN